MSPPRAGRYTAAQREKALKEAEKELVRPAVDEPKTAKLLVSQIETWPELFQPREFAFGARETDDRFVGRLERRINNVGALDPVTVIKLSGRWVCVDGHHRLEAYRKSKHQGPIECEWFPGTAREAFDASVQRNIALKLEVPIGDRQEAAWQRVVMGGWTKPQIIKTCGVSAGVVDHMRRVAARYRDRSDRTKPTRQFRSEVGKLEECSWWRASLANRNATPGERTLEQKAQSLAKALRTRFTRKLSEDPEVTARALLIYDPLLREPLMKALKQTAKENESFEQVSDQTLRRWLREHEQEAEKIETELLRRVETGWTPSDAAWTKAVAGHSDSGRED